MTGEYPQTICAFLRNKREATIPLTLKIDMALGLERGFTAKKQMEHKIQEILKREGHEIPGTTMRKRIIKKIKDNGGLWSYKGYPYSLPDDEIIEEGLRHLELEEMDELLKCWDIRHIRKVWRERMVSQGNRLSTLNYILACVFFKIKKPNQYLKSHAAI